MRNAGQRDFNLPCLFAPFLGLFHISSSPHLFRLSDLGRGGWPVGAVRGVRCVFCVCVCLTASATSAQGTPLLFLLTTKALS